MYFGAIDPYSTAKVGVPTSLYGCTDADFAAALKQLHSISVAIHQLQEEYDSTGDKRFLDSIETLIGHYKTWMQKAKTIAECLHDKEMPSSFMLALDSFSDWMLDRGRDITNIVSSLTNPLVLLGVGALALFIVSRK